MIPRKGLNTESKMSACNGALSSPFGAGMRAMMASSISSTPCPVLPEAQQNVFALAADQVDHLVDHLVDHRRVDVDLVEHGDDFQIVPDGQIEVRNRLCLDALRGVDHQQRPFARGDRARHLVGEVDVSRRVDQVEHVPLAVARGVFHLDGVALDGDALLAFEVHVVEYLRLHLALVQGVGFFQQPVGQRAFAVVDVGDDAKIAYVLHVNPLVLSLRDFGACGPDRGTAYIGSVGAVAAGGLSTTKIRYGFELAECRRSFPAFRAIFFRRTVVRIAIIAYLCRS